MKHGCCLFLAGTVISGCANVNLSTSEPLQVDVKMKVDVDSKGALTGKAENSPLSAAEERRNLSHPVQALKNDRKVGEGRDGFLVLRETPSEPGYADFAQQTVTRENDARRKLFLEKAALEGKTEKEYAREFAERAREASYPGEWVQMENGTWKKK